MCCSAVNDGSCSPWVMCSCSVVRGNQIRDTWSIQMLQDEVQSHDDCIIHRPVCSVGKLQGVQ